MLPLHEEVQRLEKTNEQLKSELRATIQVRASVKAAWRREECMMPWLRRLYFYSFRICYGSTSSLMLGPFSHTQHHFFNCVKRWVKMIVEPTDQACHKTLWDLARCFRYGNECLSAAVASTRCFIHIRSAFGTLHLSTSRPIIWCGFTDDRFCTVDCVDKNVDEKQKSTLFGSLDYISPCVNKRSRAQ